MKRSWKRWILLLVPIYFGLSWIPFVTRPKIHATSEVPVDAVSAVKNYCETSDYLWKYHWGIRAAEFWQEPFTHRELRKRRIEVSVINPTRIEAYCPSTELATWFDLRGDDWRLDHTLMLTF